MICKTVVVLLSYFFSILCVANTDTTLTFILPSKVEITIIESPFQKANFDVEGCSEQSMGCRINGYIPYGVAFGLPKTFVKSITVLFQDKSYELDVSNMYNAWGNRPLEYTDSVRYFGGKCFDKKSCHFRGIFSDASGSFVAEWVIINGYVTRTVLTSSDDVVNLFIHHIEPPEFD
jgi:hypothetical protein